jgi:hypothetical protein
LRNIGLALAMVGGFLGLRAAIVTTLAWGFAVLACRLAMRGRRPNNWQLALLWPITLTYIVAWRHVAAAIGW